MLNSQRIGTRRLKQLGAMMAREHSQSEILHMSYKLFAAAALACLLPFAALVHAQDSGPYKVLKIQLVGGEGGFDYVTADPDGRNLYVARSGPTGHIGVYNLDTLAQVGDLPGVSAHGGAVDTSTGHGFATSKPVTMFDSRNL